MNIFNRNKTPLLFALFFSFTPLVCANDYVAGESQDAKIFNAENKGLGFTGGKSIIYVSRALSSATSIYSTGEYDYDNGGCIQNIGVGNLHLDTNLAIPGGSRIVSVTMLYKNNGGGSLSYDLYSSSGAGQYNVVSTQSIPATTGYNNVGEFFWLDVTPSQSYVIRANVFNDSGIPCVFRVGYIPAGLASDIIFVNNFFR